MTSRTIWIDCDAAALGGIIRDRDGNLVKIARGTSVTLKLTCLEDGALDAVTSPTTARVWIKDGQPEVAGQDMDESVTPLVDVDVASSLATVSTTQYAARSAATFTCDLTPTHTAALDAGLMTLCLFATKTTGFLAKTWLSGQIQIVEDQC